MSATPLRVFISYSHADRRWKERLATHLRDLPGQIEVWEDGRIDAGSEWNPEIEKAIDQAGIAVLLVSDNFLASPFILEHEVPRLRERQKNQNVRVMPLIVAPCKWEEVPWLAELQVRPRDPRRPLSTRSTASTDRELTRFVLELWRVGFGAQAPAADRRAVQARQLLVDLPRIGYALLPLIFMIGAALGGSAARVDTNVQVNAAARTLSFTVGGDTPVQLLDNSTLLSGLVIENCGVVSLPPVHLEPADGRSSHTGVVRFRCNPEEPGSRIQLRPMEPNTVREIGSLNRVPLQPGDQVLVETDRGTRPSVRFEVSRKAPFEFTLTAAPFEIESAYAALEGSSLASDVNATATYRATVADEDGVRLVSGESRRALKLVLVPPAGGTAGGVFRSELDVPLIDPSLAQRDDALDRIAATTITGTLTYPGHPGIPAVPIDRGDRLTLCDRCGFNLTRLSLGREDNQSALAFSLRGTATTVVLDGQDRRLTMLDSLLVNRAAVIAIGAYAIVTALWLYRYWPTRSATR